MNRVERYLFAPIAAPRTQLLGWLLPAMLAIDIWTLMIGHAGRYGVAGFNVAHFPWLDHLPLPTPDIYIGLLVLAGMLSLVFALGQRSVGVAVALISTYSLSWSISMLDSYQHHYFLSLLLVGLVCVRTGAAGSGAARQAGGARKLRAAPADVESAAADGDDVVGDDVVTESGPGFSMIATTVALLYAYAALAKCDGPWLSGHTLTAISQAETILEPAAKIASDALGVPRAQFFSWVAMSVIPLELLIAAAYALCPLRDSARLGWGAKRLVQLGFVLALLLHLGAEGLELKIGWFSYYMLVLAWALLGPARWVRGPTAVGRALASAAQRMLTTVEADSGRWVAPSAMACVGSALFFVGTRVQLPGAAAATAALAGCMVAGSVMRALGNRARTADGSALGAVAALAIATVALLVAVTQSEVRFDYYRFLAGDLNRRGEAEAALQAYRQAERFAPAGRSRAAKIRTLERRLGR